MFPLSCNKYSEAALSTNTKHLIHSSASSESGKALWLPAARRAPGDRGAGPGKREGEMVGVSRLELRSFHEAKFAENQRPGLTKGWGRPVAKSTAMLEEALASDRLYEQIFYLTVYINMHIYTLWCDGKCMDL